MERPEIADRLRRQWASEWGEAQRAMIRSEEHRLKIRTGMAAGDKCRAHIERLAAAARGRKRPADVVARIAAANRGRKRSDEAKARMSKAAKLSPKAAAARARRYELAGGSGIERIVRGWLDAWGVEYATQMPIGRYSTDICVPARSLVIECDGTYWHKYTQERDERRDRFMVGLGYQVLRLSESEIRSGDCKWYLRALFGIPAHTA